LIGDIVHLKLWTFFHYFSFSNKYIGTEDQMGTPQRKQKPY